MSLLDDEWARCSPWIEAALKYADGTHDLADVRDEVDRQQAILWPGERSAVVTQICLYPRKKYLTFWLAGGDLKELIGKMLPEIEAFARSAGFDRLSAPGRKGWLKVLAKEGYSPTWSICTKDLT